MTGATCSQIDRAKAFAKRNGFEEREDGIYTRGGLKAAPTWQAFYVRFLLDVERDPCH